MFKKILIVLVVLIAAFIAVGLFLPKDYAVTRSAVIEAKPATIHALVGDLERWPEWTPWKEADPSVEVTLGEKTTGVGASQTWTSKDGRGSLTFTQWDPKTGIAYDMAFEQYTSSATMRYEPQGEATKVTWRMEGRMDGVVGGYFVLLMDGVVGDMFEKGLARLKAKAE